MSIGTLCMNVYRFVLFFRNDAHCRARDIHESYRYRWYQSVRFHFGVDTRDGTLEMGCRPSNLISRWLKNANDKQLVLPGVSSKFIIPSVSMSWIFFSFLLDSLKKRWSRQIRIDVHSGWLVEYWYDVSFFCVFAYFLPWLYQSMALYLWYTILRFSSGRTNCPGGITHGQRTSKKCKMIVRCFCYLFQQKIFTAHLLFLPTRLSLVVNTTLHFLD